MKILFAYINAYSAHGGIQTFNQNFLHALASITENEKQIQAISLQDKASDFPTGIPVRFQTAAGNRMRFVWQCFRAAMTADAVVIGHVNLLFPLILLVKGVLRKKVILITHGIEIWRPLSGPAKRCLAMIDTIVTVSRFTRNRIMEQHGISADRIKILPNTLDAGFDTTIKGKPDYLLRHFGLLAEDKIILTVCRMVTGEKNKGYDTVIRCIASLKKQVPSVKYVLAGKYDAAEKERLDALIASLELQEQVVFTGFVRSEELPDMYALCDVFIMASQKEGFGIVFLEALVKGKPVIGGNKDGSADALLQGELGILVNPDSDEEITAALSSVLSGRADPAFYDAPALQRRTLDTFGIPSFIKRVHQILNS